MVIKSLKKACSNKEYMRCCSSACCPAQKLSFLNEIYMEKL